MSSSYALSEICRKIVDCPHKTAPETTDEPYGFAVGTKAIRGGRINFDKAKPVSQETYDDWIQRLRPSEGDIIFCREAPVGESALIPSHPRVCLGQRTVLLRPDKQVVDPHFLLYALHGPTAQERMHSLAGGSTVPHLNVSDVRSLRLEIPDLETQRRIAGVLTALDAKMSLNRDLTETLRTTISLEFSAKFIEPAEHSDWPVRPLATLASEIKDLVKGERDEPYIGLDAMPRGSTVLTEWKTEGAPTGQARLFQRNDILFGKLRPYFKKVGPAPISGRASTEIVVLRANEDYWGFFLGHISSDAFIEHCNGVSKGTRMPRAEWKDAGAYAVAIPSVSEVAEFNTLATRCYEWITELIHEMRTLHEIRDALLPKLISGDIELPDTYDPSGVLDELVDETQSELAAEAEHEVETVGAGG